MFDVPFYLKLVNGEFANDLAKKVTEKEVKTGSPRIVVKLEVFFKDNPLIRPGCRTFYLARKAGS